MFPVIEGDRCIEAICMEMDITERKKVEKRLEYLSTHDPLTGLYNRGFFEEKMLDFEDPRFQPVSIIICDVDDLKLVNDTLGHDQGDILLKATAAAVRFPFRSTDIVARIGGDEFAIILPRTNKDAAQKACRRIEESIYHHNISRPELYLSVSLGVGTSDESDQGLIETFKRADSSMYRNKLNKTNGDGNAMVRSLLSTVGGKDSLTKGYSNKIKEMAVALGKEVGLSQKELATVSVLALVHDIGEVGVPENILYKQGKLLPKEREIIEKHPEIGYRIALASAELASVAEYILSHHEWWNGKGYPLGLKETEIPIASRIISLVDAYNAMTSERPYREALSHEEAIAEIQRCAGTQFDPELVKIHELFTGDQHPNAAFLQILAPTRSCYVCPGQLRKILFHYPKLLKNSWTLLAQNGDLSLPSGMTTAVMFQKNHAFQSFPLSLCALLFCLDKLLCGCYCKKERLALSTLEC